jgi:hypothetical protein
MTTQPTRLSGDEWERWANKLLTCHHGPTEYQKVPSNDRGDAGIEGFVAADGLAYQAYGCEEPVGTRKRYELQRDKMTKDIAKFINNKAALTGIFKSTVVIKRWVLLVPYYDSREIVVHAAAKTDEVIEANLSYVAPDFRVMVCQEDDFPIARDQLLNAHAGSLRIEVDGAATDVVQTWASSNSALFATLQEKIGRMPTMTDASRRQSFCEQVLKWHLDGQSLLEALRSYPEIYEKVRAAKNHQENYLAMDTLDAEATKSSLMGPLEALKVALQREVRELHHFNADTLSYEAVADWLLRCPLDFPKAV